MKNQDNYLDGSIYVHVVTHNHENCIERCLDSILAQQTSSALHLHVTDNASQDGTATRLNSFARSNTTIEINRTNSGFALANNRALEVAHRLGYRYFCLVNPDLWLEPDCLEKLVRTLSLHTEAGMICPKLLQTDNLLNPIVPRQIDSAGICITPAIRHFDRANGKPDSPAYDQPRYVFGASGALVLMRVDFAIDVELTPKLENQGIRLFDEAFFAWREDADLSWRAQWRGWKCLYLPSATAWHRRSVTPEKRESLPREVNAYGVKNRFLLQYNNLSFGLWLACWPYCPLRNLLVIVACRIKEKSSWPALVSSYQLRHYSTRQRQALLRSRRTSSGRMSRWFCHDEYTEPALLLCDGASELNSNKKIRRITICIVSYRSGQRLVKLLDRLRQTMSGDTLREYRVAVIDNSACPQLVAELNERFGDWPCFELLENDRNLGFAEAVNKAGKASSDAILVLNPDILIDLSAIETLAKELDQFERLGAIAPVLLDMQNHTPQWEFNARALPSIGSSLAEVYGIHILIPNNPASSRYLMRGDKFFQSFLLRVINRSLTPTFRDKQPCASSNAIPQQPENLPLVVEQPAAAAIMIRTEAFREVHGMDTNFWPAWFEDVDLLKRLKENGWISAISSRATALHEGGYSATEIGKSVFTRHWFRNQFYYWRKHSPLCKYLLLRLAFTPALLLRSIAELGTNPFSKNSLPVALEYIRAVFSRTPTPRKYTTDHQEKSRMSKKLV